MMKSTKGRIGFSAAAAAIVILAVTGTTMAGPFNPQNGDCKFVAQNAVGPTAETAQAAWVGLVAGKFGTKWAHWVGAKNKVIIPGNGYYTAMAKPCFYQPVL